MTEKSPKYAGFTTKPTKENVEQKNSKTRVFGLNLFNIFKSVTLDKEQDLSNEKVTPINSPIESSQYFEEVKPKVQTYTPEAFFVNHLDHMLMKT